MGTSVTLVKQYGNPTFNSLTVSGSTNFTGSLNITGSLRTTGSISTIGSITATTSITAATFTGSGVGLTNIPNSATTATSANTGNAIVTRDGSGNFNAGSITLIGNQFINNTSPTIYLQDTDHRSSMIHCNSNIFYVLRGSGNNSTTWAQFNGYWPLEINLENNNAQFGGSITAVGDVTAFSDVRVKKNITTIEKALDKVLQLRGVSYQRNDMEDDKTHIGVIAQEIQQILPEVVSENDKGYLNVAYGNIVGILIEAIKEQQSQIEELKTTINGLTR
jgi:hypothetical protein